MRILVLSPTQPLPANNGARLRIFNSIKYLSENNSIILVTLAQRDGMSLEEKRELMQYCEHIKEIKHLRTKLQASLQWLISKKPYRYVKMYNRKLAKAILECINKCDVVLCNFLETSQSLRVIPKPNRAILYVMDQHNADELWFESFVHSGSHLKKLFGEENLRRLRRIQFVDYKLYDLVLCVSEEDAASTGSITGNIAKIVVAPNGVDVDYFRPGHLNRVGNKIMFCGSLDTTMNQEAVLYFYHRIFPEIKRQVPSALFLVVGRNPPLRIKRLKSNDDIIVTGTVKDVRPYYEVAKAVVAPFRLGGGTKLKILEAMAMRVPVVATTVGCQGLRAQNGVHLLVADQDLDFADKVVDILRGRPTEIIEAAYSLVYNSYSWRSISAYVEGHIRRSLQEMLRKYSSF